VSRKPLQNLDLQLLVRRYVKPIGAPVNRQPTGAIVMERQKLPEKNQELESQIGFFFTNSL
jgi:hypothetical protein